MTRSNSLRRAVRHALIVSAITTGAAGSAFAADAVTEVVITGSRIPQPRLESVSPVASVSTEEIAQSGATRVEDLLNTLPQVMSDFGANLANGATGTATVSLRGLGANRTMVLVNGRRLMPGDPTQNGNAAPDLNQIPAALVERVDVLTGGASAVYGADAVAGVVNFVMNDHFEGVRIDANYSFFNHQNHQDDVQNVVRASGFALPDSTVNDGISKDFTIVVGGNFADGRGNATAYVGYRRANAVTQGQRDFSSCSLTSSGGALTCGGSVSAAPAIFLIGGNYYSIGANNAIVPASFAGSTNNLYNYAPLNYYQRPDERYTAGVFAHYDMSDHATAYMEFMFMDDRTKAQIAPSGAFFGSGTGVSAGVPDASWVVNCDNPYLSTSELNSFCAGSTASPDAHLTFGRRNVEGGPRIDDLGHTSFRTVFGVRGDIADGWTYDVYALNGITRLNEEYLNDVSRTRLSNALLAVNDPLTGQVVCRANANGANGAPGCVPYNIFQLGGVSQAAIKYFSVPGLSKGATTERVVSAAVTGDLTDRGVKLPTASEGLGLSVGAEYREEKSELFPDIEYITNDLAGQGAPTLPTIGSFHVWEAFTEMRLPILSDAPGAKSLTAELGYRYSDYDLAFGSTDTYKLGIQWAPIDDLRVRGTYQRAVRAPNIQELFLQPRVQLDGVTDPCAGATPTATAAQCLLSGVSATEYRNIAANPSKQYNGLVGGNPNLVPEEADTYTVGLVFTPAFLPDFNATLDYYDIKIKNVISSYGSDLVLATCLNTGNPFYCGKVHRVPETGTPADGSLWIGDQGWIEDGTYNLGSQHASGIDLTAQYNLDISAAGRLGFELVGNYDLKFETEPVPGLGTYDCVGFYGATCGVPAPKWRHKFRTTWETPYEGLEAWLTWRYIGKVDNEATNSSPLLSGGTTEPGTHVASFTYLDLGASFTFATNYSVRLGINNILDKDPPLMSAGYLPTVLGNGNTIPQTYDTLGRYVFLNLKADF